MKTSKNKQQIGQSLGFLIIVVVLLTVSIQNFAQSGNKNTLLQMIDEDRTTIDAIAGFDKNIQNHIFRLACTPEVLNRMEELQNRSQNQFKSIISGFDQETQGAFYDLARYPNLITDLVRNDRLSNSEIDRIVSNYPQDIRETAQKYGPRYHDILLSIDRLNNEIDKEFQILLEPYNQQTHESVTALLGYPEIVSSLASDKDFTKVLGDVYREDPNWVIARLDQISREIAENKRQDLDAYKNQIQQDPEAYQEMLDASERFSRERNEVRYLDNYSEPIVDINVIRSYPYWFGYPYWYTEPYWRPRPLYYHTGFYRNHTGNVIFVGLPSGFFLHWQSFYHPRMFPHLSYNYYNFYENHYMQRYRESPRTFPHNGFYRSIESNVINNPRVNNRELQRIDQRRGNNIVRQPNTNETRSYSRYNAGINRQSEPSNSRNGTGTNNPIIRRQYNISNSNGAEGSYNRRTYTPRNSSVQRGNSVTPSSSGETRTVRPQGRSATNSNNYNRPRSSGANYNRPRDNSVPSSSPQLKSAGSGSAAQPSGSSTRREAKTVIKQAPARREARQKRAEVKSRPAEKSNNDAGSGRRQ